MVKSRLTTLKEIVKSPTYISYAALNLMWIIGLLIATQDCYSDELLYCIIALVVHVIALFPHPIPIVLASLLQIGNICLAVINSMERYGTLTITIHFWFSCGILVLATGFVIYAYFAPVKKEPSEVTEINDEEGNVLTRKPSRERWF